MKTILLLLLATITLQTAKAQYSENFEGGIGSLTGSCWTIVDVFHTTNPAEVITGTGSMYTNPPTSGAGTRDIYTPALVISSTAFTVSFNYKITSKINGNATRTIQVGLVDVEGNFTQLALITMDKYTPTTVQSFNQDFTLATTGLYKLVLKLGGATGDGNSRIIFDDITATATPLYAGGCNSAPIAVNDVFYGTTGNPISGNVILNDNEPNGEMMYSSIVVTSPNGTVVLNTDGSFTFTPNPGWNGLSTTFTYQLVDNGFAPDSSNIATVTLNFPDGVALPVKLLSFTAQLNGTAKVDLKWSTSTEINASHFVIERSFDGQEYTEIGLVFAAGNSTTIQNYIFIDDINSITKSILYYRLRQVDVDGKAEYSATRIIRTGKQIETVAILTYPNPVTNEVRITIPANWQGKQVSYELVNAGGQVIYQTIAAKATQTEVVSTNTLAPGFYVVRVSSNGEIAFQKIVKR